ncbi:glutamine--tRNA ligase/YqeY domain fusion protein [Tessaracoccus sp. OH4464_COT-324]|uniref:glutamine--tRNA ligase/YqeY domain fusion protein n=1 Tax=Tessaracoccus sp. OH4464_COT-324 TaxID=2491059 RepID=UPI0026A64030
MELPSNYLYEAVKLDNAAGRYGQRVQTRFPPEPNGFLHIGHAKAIVTDFSVAEDFGGICMLRLDDTNPEAEDDDFVQAIIEDIRWLGYEPAGVRFASDYFGQLYEWAEQLIRKGLAYVDDSSAEAISAARGSFTEPGTDSPYRQRSVEENLDLFRRMRAGEFPDGSRVLRAKIDMGHENMQLRDPLMYRIRKVEHHQTGWEWPIYPTYDWAHGQSDAIEGVTHSLCSLEFESHRPLYDWFTAALELDEAPRQIEFARLELTHTVTSKRRLLRLVTDGVVDGWDDARMPTIRGLRRRGYPAAAIRAFCKAVGITRVNSRKAIEELESFVRRELNATAQRRMAVLRPLKLTLTNWPVDDAGQPVVEYFELTNNPENAADGTRSVPFTGQLYIETEDFMEVPPPKYFRLSPGKEVRLRGAYFVTATDVVKDEAGNVVEVLATYDPESKGGNSPDGRKVKSTMHWVSRPHAVDFEAALYERLFTAEAPGAATGEALDDLNPSSREIVTGCKAEPALGDTPPGEVVQFERIGYFSHDPDKPMHFHRTVGLRDEWAAAQKRPS